MKKAERKLKTETKRKREECNQAMQEVIAAGHVGIPQEINKVTCSFDETSDLFTKLLIDHTSHSFGEPAIIVKRCESERNSVRQVFIPCNNFLQT